MTTTTCYFCGTDKAHPELPAMFVNNSHWTGDKYTRVDACHACAAAGKFQAAPKVKRTRRPRQVAATDYNMLCAFVRKTGERVK